MCLKALLNCSFLKRRMMSVKVILAMMTQFAVIALALFVPAGTLNWPAGWMFLVLLTGFIIAVALLLARHNPELLEERASFFRANQKGCDTYSAKVKYRLIPYVW